MQTLILNGQAQILRDQHEKYAGAELSELVVPVKFFGLNINWRWYLLTQDPDDPDYLWAIVKGFELEMGSVSLSELAEQRYGGIPAIERDIHFKPMNAKELWDKLSRGEHV